MNDQGFIPFHGVVDLAAHAKWLNVVLGYVGYSPYAYVWSEE